MRPRLVIFDMDGVLCGYDLGRRLRALSRMSGRRPRDIRAAIWDSGFEDDADAGCLPAGRSYLDEFGRRLGHALSEDEWIAARRESMQPWPEMLELASGIGRQARLAIFTNNGPLMNRRLPDVFPEAASVFGDRICSCELGLRKPDPEAYRKLLGRLGEDAAASWFIDDKLSNVEGARMAGIASHHFRSPGLFRQAARAAGFVV